MKDERQYLDLAEEILEVGALHGNRTGTDTKRVIGRTMRFDLSDNKIPVFTTKKVHWKSIVMELCWMLSGDTNNKWLEDNGVRIWREWSDMNGDLGPIYGKQFREQKTIFTGKTGNEVISKVDPLASFIDGLKNNPESRRHIISLWNQAEIPYMNLPPCHGISIQASVIDGELTIEMYQRSCDMFLGVPFNVAWYSLFTHMIAKECDLIAKEFIWHGHDCHVYVNHKEQIELQASREIYDSPKIKLDYTQGLIGLLNVMKNRKPDWSEVKKLFKLVDYKHHEAIKGKVAV